MQKALHFRFLLDHPQYADRKDLELFQDADIIYYAKQGRDWAREVNVTINFHNAKRSERNSYRSRLKEMKVPRDEQTGRCLCQTG